ncbi:hypothetical protein GQ43DRAFT_501381 [Delitschia confertaspora ATCC 74209]|uniref:Tetratricopeptide repeat protein n=1 Tax=Delitschia confertaspora ATCC 74209 TaxID=1513339 RepID=A0A9P4MU00_9PLEO|nr:hypothetical protein GQ43DRAFT_501381 [Delitschia confertaspora ATCC 74209]
MEMRKSIFRGEHPDMLTSMGSLASILTNQGWWKEAEELEVQAIDTIKRILGEEHPDMLVSEINLIFTFKASLIFTFSPKGTCGAYITHGAMLLTSEDRFWLSESAHQSSLES